MQEKTEYKGLSIRIEPDQDAESPDQWGNTDMFLVGFHREFAVNRDGFGLEVARAVFDSDYADDESVADRAKKIKKEYHVFPLEAYIHSGVSLSIGGEGKFPDRQWDVSQLGAVFVEKKQWRKVESARKAARSLIETWNQYLSGDVWGYVVEDQDGESLDSCWGFYGRDEAIEAAKESADGHAADIKKNKPMYRAEAKKILEKWSPAMIGGVVAHRRDGVLKALEIAIKNL